MNGPIIKSALSRRRLLGGAALGLTAGALGRMVGPASIARAATASSREYDARNTFDEVDQEFHTGGYNGQPDQPNDSTGGGLAWVQSYILQGFLRMYQAYGDYHYLDRLVDNVDQILETRDSIRGVTDYRGLSLPGWRATNPYTAGSVILSDLAGKDLLEVRTSTSGANSAKVTVLSGQSAGRFSLRVENSRYPTRTEEHSSLSMDPDSPDYVERRLYDAFNPYALNVTVRDFATGRAGSVPAPGEYAFVAQPVIFSVDTGMVTYAIAGFARTVLSSRSLRQNRRYKQKAMTYLRAAEDAVAIHEPEWREQLVRGKRIGYYQWEKGTFRSFDGTEQPLNWSHAVGQTLVELAAITRKATYMRKVRLLAELLRYECAVDAGGACVWHYWPKFGAMYNGYKRTGSPETDVSLFTPEFPATTRVEDISHAAISVEFATRAFEERLAFRRFDIDRLVATYSENLARVGSDGIPTTATLVDGSGNASAGYYLQAPRWMPLARWNASIFDHSLSIYAARQPNPVSGYGLLAIAYFNWYRQRY